MLHQPSNPKSFPPSLPSSQPAVGRLEVGSPIASEETLIWHGHPSFAYSITKFLKSGIFFVLWLYLYSQRMQILEIPAVWRALIELSGEISRSPAQLVQWASYILVFFIFLNLLKIIKTYLIHINTTYTLSSQRILVKTGILNISSAQIELYRMKDYSMSQSLWARMCGYAHLNVISSDRIMPRAYLWALPDSGRMTESLRRAAQVARAESGSVTITE